MIKNVGTPAFRGREAGFTLMETIVAMAVLVSILAVVFGHIGNLQRVYRAEETKVDATQEARTFFDSLERELHQAGYPGKTTFAPGVLNAPPENDLRDAVGLVSLTKWDLWFEGDVDNDGNVESVRYTLLDSAGNVAGGGSTCPCTLQRTVIAKGNGVPNTQISAADITSKGVAALNNVVNSGDGSGNALSLTGSFSGHSYDSFYSAYKSAPIFQAFDGLNPTPIPLPASAAALPSIRKIVVTANLLTTYTDTRTNTRAPLTMTMTIKLNNF
jgi:prepilin-type N-terminal cleavage/methylation domain-containing protein